MSGDFEISGQNDAALFTLKLHRGEGMVLLGMNWKNGPPPPQFVGFAIEYRVPGTQQMTAVPNRLSFAGGGGSGAPASLSSREAPIQGFRWVHFPPDPDVGGALDYRVTPVFMDAQGQLSYGDPQEATIDLGDETYPGQLNVAFTRGFVASQAFVDRYASHGESISTLLPAQASDGLTFQPSHPQAAEALAWMGFKARAAILGVLNEALNDPEAQVRVIAYDFDLPDVFSCLQQLGSRLRIIIDDSEGHGDATSAETTATTKLSATAGAGNVKRQHMGKLQHNKTIVVDGPTVQAVVCGSTNFSWRGWYVQNNNAMVLRGKGPVGVFTAAFENYWAHGEVQDFGATASATWQDAGLDGIDAQVTFSPHVGSNQALSHVADDMKTATSSLFFSLAFLNQTPGIIEQAIAAVMANPDVFVYGISDREDERLALLKPDGKEVIVSPGALTGNVPEPFRSEPTGGSGIRMHHKFVVIDFDKPTARVYMGSHNFSSAADTQNGENLVLVRDRRVATSYMIEAVRICDHYHFRDAQQTSTALVLARPPQNPGEQPWWASQYSDQEKILARELFS